MSMISEQIKELKELAYTFEGKRLGKILEQAVETIESLSAKLSVANMERSERCYNGGWIPCDELLPEEKENPLTKDWYEYQVTFQMEDVTDIRYYKFGNGHWWNSGEIMDEYVTAWKPRPIPYKDNKKLKEVEND